MFAAAVAFLCGVIFQPVLKVLYVRLVTKAKKEE
jgi:hypothetical protein